MKLQWQWLGRLSFCAKETPSPRALRLTTVCAFPCVTYQANGLIWIFVHWNITPWISSWTCPVARNSCNIWQTAVQSLAAVPGRCCGYAVNEVWSSRRLWDVGSCWGGDCGLFLDCLCCFLPAQRALIWLGAQIAVQDAVASSAEVRLCVWLPTSEEATCVSLQDMVHLLDLVSKPSFSCTHHHPAYPMPIYRLN